MDASTEVGNMGEDTTIRVSKELADELYQRKGRTTSYEDYIWELLERIEETEESENIEDIAESGSSVADVENDRTDAETKEETYEPLPETPEAAENAEEALRELDLPGSGSKYETRVQAVLTFYEYLRNHPGEPMEKSDFGDLVEERDLDVGYSSFTSLWNNWVKSNASQGRDVNTLAQLPGVEMEGDEYVYTVGSNE